MLYQNTIGFPEHVKSSLCTTHTHRIVHKHPKGGVINKERTYKGVCSLNCKGMGRNK